MPFELFDKIIRHLREWHDFCTKISDATGDSIRLYELCYLEDDIAEMLATIFKDKEAEWINYFCWDLDFGRWYELGCARETDGTPIPLGTTKELYDLLIKNMEGSKE